MKAPFSYLPALPAAAGLIVGILLAPTGGGAWAGIAISLVLAVVLYVRRLHYISLISLFVGIGLMMADAHRPYSLPEAWYGHKVRVVAEVEAVNESAGAIVERLRIIAIDSHPVRAVMCRATVLSGMRPPCPGTKIEMICVLEPLSASPKLPFMVDYDRYLQAEGITCKTTVRGEDIKVWSEAPACQQWLQHVRDALYHAIVTSPIDTPTAAFLAATLLGDDQLMPGATVDAFRDVGVAHVLALSGLHVGILVGLFAILLFPVGLLRRGRMLRSVVTLIAVWTFVLITGFTPSIVRAAVMISVFTLARHLQRGYSPWNSLLLSVIIILCINPRWFSTPGFQLSVSAVASILAFGSLVPKTLKRRPAIYYLVNMLVIPVAAMIGTGMVSAYYFGVVPWWFLVSNVIAGILVPLIIGGGGLLTLLEVCGWSMSWLGAVVQWAYHLLEGSMELLAGIDGMVSKGLEPPAVALLPYYLAVALAALGAHYRSRRLWIGSAGALVLTLAVLAFSIPTLPEAELYMLPESHGQQVILRTADGTRLYELPGQPPLGIPFANDHYRPYLSSRGSKAFIQAEPGYRQWPFAIDTLGITAGHNDIAIVAADPGANQWHPDTSVRYALVTRAYAGSISRIIEALHPDTLLLASDIYPSRRRRLIQECADSVAYRDLSRELFALVWPKK